jgi:glutamyl-tRNA reductase
VGSEISERARRGRSSRGALRELSPTIVALRQRLEQIRSAELERYRRKLGALEPVQRRALEALTQGILNKILHGPVYELNAHAGTPEQHALAQLVGRIFGLRQ